MKDMLDPKRNGDYQGLEPQLKQNIANLDAVIASLRELEAIKAGLPRDKNGAAIYPGRKVKSSDHEGRVAGVFCENDEWANRLCWRVYFGKKSLLTQYVSLRGRIETVEVVND